MDSQMLSKDQFKNKWKATLGDEYTGKNSKARFKNMKECHDEAKNRIFVAAAEHGLLSRLGHHLMEKPRRLNTIEYHQKRPCAFVRRSPRSSNRRKMSATASFIPNLRTVGSARNQW